MSSVPFKRERPMTDSQLISMKEACRMTSASRTWLNLLRSQGKFPKAVPLGDKRVAFVRAEVQQWIADRIAGREIAA